MSGDTGGSGRVRAGGGEREVEYVASEESEQRVVHVLEALVLEQVLEQREHVLGTLVCQVLAATRQEVHQTLVFRQRRSLLLNVNS